jgi:hypothetical protein
LHGRGFIGAIHWTSGKVFSGGKDGVIHVVNDKDFEPIQSFNYDGILIRAIDTQGDNMIVGTRAGDIIETDMSSAK